MLLKSHLPKAFYTHTNTHAISIPVLPPLIPQKAIGRRSWLEGKDSLGEEQPFSHPAC